MNALLSFIIDNNDVYNNVINEIRNKDLNNINTLHQLKQKYKTFPINELLSLYKIQKQASGKFPFAYKWLFTDKSHQQASHFLLSKFHGNLFNDYCVVADLCCGIGADLLFLSKGKVSSFAVDCDDTVLGYAKYNMTFFNRNNIIYQHKKAEDFIEDAEAIFIDPDRRNNNKRKIDPNDFSPMFSEIEKTTKKYRNIAIKSSPLMDYENTLYNDFYLDFVSLDGQLKECLLKTFSPVNSKNNRKRAVMISSLIPNITSIFEQKNHPSTDITDIKKYIIEPDPAIIRAHLINDLAYELGVNRIDNNISLLTSDISVINTNQLIGRNIFTEYMVKEVFNYNLKDLNAYIKSNEIGIIDIKTKGFSEPVESFRRKLKLKGKKQITLFITRLDRKHICIVS
jgi:hypothetical protein